MATIGKTTYKTNKPPKSSETMIKLREERRILKNDFQEEKSPTKKKKKLRDYVKKQVEIKQYALEEES